MPSTPRSSRGSPRIPVRIGYNRDGRGLLLTHAIPVPEPGEIPRHERFYYLELLRRAGLMERFPAATPSVWTVLTPPAPKDSPHVARLGIQGPAIGISPGAAYGTAKRWPRRELRRPAAWLSHPRANPPLRLAIRT